MKKNDAILVLGATGTVGGELVRQLVARNQRVRAGSRDPGRAADLLSAGAEVVELDLERPGTFAPALQGVDRVFLVARPGDEHPEVLACPLIDELRRHPVRHVVNLSALGAERRPDFGLRRVERYLESSGIASTHLRPNWFFQIFSSGPLHEAILRRGVIGVPAASARISFVDARDVAAVAAVALTRPGHAGKAYALTGAAAYDHADVANAISEVAGRRVAYHPIDEETAGRALRASGLPPEWVERLIGFYRLVRRGMCAPVSPDTARVLGRAPLSLRRFVADYQQRWSGFGVASRPSAQPA